MLAPYLVETKKTPMEEISSIGHLWTRSSMKLSRGEVDMAVATQRATVEATTSKRTLQGRPPRLQIIFTYIHTVWLCLSVYHSLIWEFSPRIWLGRDPLIFSWVTCFGRGSGYSCMQPLFPPYFLSSTFRGNLDGFHFTSFLGNLDGFRFTSLLLTLIGAVF